MRKITAILISVAMVVALFAFAAPAMAAEELITNGGFELGDQDFTSDYTYVPVLSTSGGIYNLGTMDPEQRYAIGTDPALGHQSWTSYLAHSGSNMMIVNATPTSPEKTVWQQIVNLPVCDPVTSFKLYAGQTWEIGEVLVKNDVTGKICVKFMLTDEDAIAGGWLITEAHVAVAATEAGIPQKNGNPIPGKFPINVKIEPGMAETDWYCLDYVWEDGVSLVIAAHAKIELAELGHMGAYNFCVTSGAATELVGGGYADVPAYDPWGAVDTNVNAIPDCPDISDWIWDADVATSFYADNGGMVDFVQGFEVIGTPTSATLKIAADNAFAFSFNGDDETDENLAAGWRTLASTGDFGYPYMVVDPNMSGWSQVYEYDVRARVQSGSNVFNVTGVNADWDTTSWSVNPAAVIYKLCGTSEQYVVDRPYDDETGWGGEGKFTGKNWAKFITYTPHVCSDNYTFSFWAANSHSDNPAELAVFVGNVRIGSVADLATIHPLVGTWKQFTFGLSGSGSKTIKIVDTFTVAQGDDFALDDISLVKTP